LYAWLFSTLLFGALVRGMVGTESRSSIGEIASPDYPLSPSGAMGAAPEHVMVRSKMVASGSPSFMEGGAGMASPPIMDASAMSYSGRDDGMIGGNVVKDGISSFAERLGASSSSQGKDAPPLPGELKKGPVILRDGSMDGEVALGAIVTTVAALEASIVGKFGGYVESSSTSTDSWLLDRWRQAVAHGGAGSKAALLVAAWGPTAERIVKSGGGGGEENAPTNSYVSLRVPADTYEAARDAVRQIFGESGTWGRLVSENMNARDVTEAYADVVSRVNVDAAALEALKDLLPSAGNVGDILSIKREMDNVNSRLESWESQRKSMEGRARMSSLSLSLRVPEPPQEDPTPTPPPQPKGWSMWVTLGSAWGSLGSMSIIAVDVLIYAAVFSIPTGLLGWGILLATRKCGLMEIWGGGGSRHSRSGTTGSADPLLAQSP